MDMYKIYYRYNHKTWLEKCSSHWLKEEEVKPHMDYLLSRNAIGIK